MNWTSVSTVVFVWLLIIFLGVAYISFYLPVLYQQNGQMFFIIVPPWVFCVMLGLTSYSKAILISPGYPEDDLVIKEKCLDLIDDRKSRLEQEKQFKRLRKQKKLTSQMRKQYIQSLVFDSYCEKCDNVKLSRVHHCKQCGKCIERMDHHCPWVGNCVGKHTHKYFILFLLYVTIALLIAGITILADYISGQIILNHIFRNSELSYYLVIMAGGMSILLSFAIGFLLITQLLMLAQNLTTLQTFYDGIQEHNPFDKGSLIQHIKQITGQSFWFLPTKPFPEHKDTYNISFFD